MSMVEFDVQLGTGWYFARSASSERPLWIWEEPKLRSLSILILHIYVNVGKHV